MENLATSDKVSLRQKHKALRSSISQEDRIAWDTAISEQLKVLPELGRAKVVFVYLSRNGEASTRGLVQALLEAGKVVLTPSPDVRALPHHGLFRVHREESGRHTDPTLCTESRIEQVDVIIVPGIVWDREGYRIGFGGGYFDRLLSMARPDCLKIGIAYNLQVIEKVPREPWDEPVDVLITETETIRIR